MARSLASTRQRSGPTVKIPMNTVMLTSMDSVAKWVASVVGPLHLLRDLQHIFESVKHSLERLQLDYIDLLQCQFLSSYQFGITLMPIIRSSFRLWHPNWRNRMFAHNLPKNLLIMLPDASFAWCCAGGICPLHWHEFLLRLAMWVFATFGYHVTSDKGCSPGYAKSVVLSDYSLIRAHMEQTMPLTTSSLHSYRCKTTITCSIAKKNEKCSLLWRSVFSFLYSDDFLTRYIAIWCRVYPVVSFGKRCLDSPVWRPNQAWYHRSVCHLSFTECNDAEIGRRAASRYANAPGTPDVMKRVEEVSKKLGISMAQVSIAWMLSKEGKIMSIVHAARESWHYIQVWLHPSLELLVSRIWKTSLVGFLARPSEIYS